MGPIVRRSFAVRLPALFLAFFCLPLLFAGCSAVKSPAHSLPGALPFTAKIALSVTRIDVTARLRVLSQNEAEFTLESPETLRGLTFLRKEGTLCLQADDAVWELPPELFPETSLLLGAFFPPPDAEFLPAGETEDGLEKTALILAGENYFYCFDASGALMRIECEGAHPFSAAILPEED